MTQFRIAYDTPSADGKRVTVHVVDPDFTRFTELPADVRRLPDCEHDACCAVLDVPAWRLRSSSVVDLGDDVHAAAVALGSRTSPKKAAAVRENGKKGGRPRKMIDVIDEIEAYEQITDDLISPELDAKLQGDMRRAEQYFDARLKGNR